MKIIWMWPAARRKLIERTCKYDAYQNVVMWGERSEVNGDGTWYAKEKMLGHRKFLQTHKYRYAYVGGFVLNDGYYGEPKS